MAVAWTATSHYLYQCWSIVNCSNQIKWKFNRNKIIFVQENALENIFWKMSAIYSRSQCVKNIFNLLLCCAAIVYWKSNFTLHICTHFSFFIYFSQRWYTFLCTRLEWVNWDDNDCPFIDHKTMSRPPAGSWVGENSSGDSMGPFHWMSMSVRNMIYYLDSSFKFI